MASSKKIEELIEAANSSTAGDTSFNVAKRVFDDKAKCDAFFEQTCSNLLSISEWNRNSSAANYKLFDEAGNDIDAEPIDAGRFIRIGLYGSGKYDWVRVLEIIDEADEFVVKVKPSHDPTQDPVDTNSTSHFLDPKPKTIFAYKEMRRQSRFMLSV